MTAQLISASKKSAFSFATAAAPFGIGAVLSGEIDGNFFGPTAQEIGGVGRLGDPSGAQAVFGFAAGQ